MSKRIRHGIVHGALGVLAGLCVWKGPVGAPFALWGVLALVWAAPRLGVRSRILAAAYAAGFVFCLLLVFQNYFIGNMIPPAAKGLALYPESAAGLVIAWAAALAVLRRKRALRLRHALDLFMTFVLAGTCLWVGYKLWPWSCGERVCREAGAVFCFVNNRDNFGLALGPRTGLLYISTADADNRLTRCDPAGGGRQGTCSSRPRGQRTAYRLAVDAAGGAVVALRGHREGAPGRAGALLVYEDTPGAIPEPRVHAMPRRGARDAWTDPSTGALYLLYKDGTLAVLAPDSLKQVRSGRVRMRFPYRIAGMHDEPVARVIVSGLGGAVHAVDGRTLETEHTARVNPTAGGVAVDARRGRMFVANPFLSRLDALGADRLAPGGAGPRAPYFVREAAADPAAGRVFAGSYRSGRLHVLDAHTGRVLDAHAGGPMLRHILPDPRRRVVYAATRCGVFGFAY